MILPNASSTMPPCKGCEIRAEGCHAICMRYAAYREELDDKRAKSRDALIKSYVTIDGPEREMRRNDKNRLQRRSGGKR